MSEHFIVTPVRNAIGTIDRTIWSIVAQAGDLDIHYHVQDGVSTDGTVERLRDWSRRPSLTWWRRAMLRPEPTPGPAAGC